MTTPAQRPVKWARVQMPEFQMRERIWKGTWTEKNQKVVVYLLEFIIPFVRDRQFYASVWDRKVWTSQTFLYAVTISYARLPFLTDITLIFKTINIFTKIKEVLVGVRGGSKSVATMDFTTVTFTWEALSHNARQIKSANENKMILCALWLYGAANPLNLWRCTAKPEDHKPQELQKLVLCVRFLPNEYLII